MTRSRSPEDRYRSRSRSPKRERSRDRRSRSREERRSRSRDGRRSRSREDRREHNSQWKDSSGTYKKNEQTSKCIGVFGLDFDTTEREVERKFRHYGRIEHLVLVWNHRENRNKGFGFITFAHVEDAEEAVKDMNGRTIEGRAVRVDYSFTKHGNKEHMYDEGGVRKQEFRDPNFRPDPQRRARRSRTPPRRSRSPRRRSRTPPRSSRRSRSRDRYRH